MMERKFRFVWLILLVAVPMVGLAQQLERVSPERVGVDSQRLLRADSVIEHAIREGEIPAGSYYLKIDEAYMWNAPEKDPVIYWDEEAALKNEYKESDEEDGLTKVELEKAVSGVYNLGGIPLKAIPSRGIYIIDGKKASK